MPKSDGTSAGQALPEQPNGPKTRPAQVTHRAARRNGDIQRYTVDLDREQRRTLALCAADWEVDKSRIVRTLLYLLESDVSLRERVQQELFADSVE
jgi:hypothetical protein